jgi:hypothetical protein
MLVTFSEVVFDCTIKDVQVFPFLSEIEQTIFINQLVRLRVDICWWKCFLCNQAVALLQQLHLCGRKSCILLPWF